MAEKREVTRFKAPLYVHYGPVASSQKLLGIAKNINARGVGLLLEKSRDVASGQMLDFTLLFPEKKVTISGVVAWAHYFKDRQEAGAYFTEVSEKQRDMIHDYIFAYFPQELTKNWWRT